jgi:cell division protein FtsI/penicillin-binding protein 2
VVKKWLLVVTVLAVLVGGTGFALHQRSVRQQARDRKEALAAGVRFLEAWPAKRYADMGAATARDGDAGSSFQNLETRLKATKVVVSHGVLSPKGEHLPFHVILTLAGLGELAWDNTLDLTHTRSGWRVAFRSATVFPSLENGQRLKRSQPLTSRGELVDRHGTPLRTASADLAANVLGSTKAEKTGLERIYDARLTGSSGGRVDVVDASTGAVLRTVKEFPPHPAEPVRTTLDLPMQLAAEAALGGVQEPASLVVVDTATGELRAIANRPVVGLPTAFQSEAPGSTFKVVVAAAALMNGWTPSRTVACPPTAVFGGKSFKNDEPLPATMTLTTAFARSCNTAFLNIANSLPKGTLRLTSALFGFGRGPLLVTGAEGGDVPVPQGTTEAYADVIGQGRVVASPLLLATMSAAVASGTWHQPHLVTGPAASVALPPAIVAPLQQLMAAVVTSGTAARAGLPAGTHGKTGTAQYGDGLPLPTHAWFTGFRGSLAFCVYLQDGASGGSAAAPVAARFLTAVGS